MSKFFANFVYTVTHNYDAELSVEADNLQEAKEKLKSLLYSDDGFWEMLVTTYQGSIVDYDIDPETDVRWTSAD